jgi:hypothetical protein
VNNLAPIVTLATVVAVLGLVVGLFAHFLPHEQSLLVTPNVEDDPKVVFPDSGQHTTEDSLPVTIGLGIGIPSVIVVAAVILGCAFGPGLWKSMKSQENELGQDETIPLIGPVYTPVVSTTGQQVTGDGEKRESREQDGHPVLPTPSMPPEPILKEVEKGRSEVSVTDPPPAPVPGLTKTDQTKAVSTGPPPEAKEDNTELSLEELKILYEIEISPESLSKLEESYNKFTITVNCGANKDTTVEIDENDVTFLDVAKRLVKHEKMTVGDVFVLRVKGPSGKPIFDVSLPENVSYDEHSLQIFSRDMLGDNKALYYKWMLARVKFPDSLKQRGFFTSWRLPSLPSFF